jgi:hypothetical protein
MPLRALLGGVMWVAVAHPGAAFAEPATDAVAAGANQTLELGHALVAEGTAVEPSGPMRLAVPADLCTRVFPIPGGLPPDHPLANRDDPGVQAAIAAHAQTAHLRALQRELCQPVVKDGDVARAQTVDPACAQPRDPEAVINPIHPLADLSRADVLEALVRHEQAKKRLEILTELCTRAANGDDPITSASSGAP